MKAIITLIALCITAYCAFFLVLDCFDANHYTDLTNYRYGVCGGVALLLFGLMLKDKRTW
jgi:hypothetical protein